MTGTILRRLLEDDDLGGPEAEDFDLKTAAEDQITASEGTVSWKGRNYNFQIRHFTVQQTGQVVDDIVIYRGGVFLGGFDLGPVLVGGYASNAEIPFGVTWELRKWFKAHGYPLEVRIDSRGYDLGKLAEVLGDEDDLDIKGISGDGPEEVIHSLDDMKRAEPGFFSRENNRHFGTKKVYKYGNFIVLKNVKHWPSHTWGPGQMVTSFVIYEFVKTADSPQGLLLHRQSTNQLYKAKAMIKRRDFRPWNEQVADDYRLGMLGLGEAEDFDLKDLDPIDPWKFMCALRTPSFIEIQVFFQGDYVASAEFRKRSGKFEPREAGQVTAGYAKQNLVLKIKSGDARAAQ